MLYDFHATENARKPNCVHATYVITGFRKPRPSTKGMAGSGGESKDMEMQYSPFDSSFPGTQTTVAGEGEEKSKKKGEELMLRVVELCQEEELDGGFFSFYSVRGIHSWRVRAVRLWPARHSVGSCGSSGPKNCSPVNTLGSRVLVWWYGVLI